MKEEIANLIHKALKRISVNVPKDKIKGFIEIPPSPEMGDYAFPCFFLSKIMKEDPQEIALELRGHIKDPPLDLDDIQTKGPYVNFFLNRKSMARQAVWDVLTHKKNYGKSDIGKRKKIIVEFSSPNIAKPFGIGHLRSTIIGNSIANILDFQNFKTIRINYLGDWGTQFGKLVAGYKKFGSENALEKNPIKHLFEIYVKANSKRYEKEAREEFKKLEEGDKKNLMLWKIFRELSVEDFKKMYKKLGIGFDVYEGESNYNKKRGEILNELKEKNFAKKSKGAYVVDLTEYGLENALVEKSDGTTLYITRDLAAAIERYKKYKFEKMIYEVGREQELYFKQLFKILELKGHKWAKNCEHVGHGHYLSKAGKKLATRKGKTFFMEDILNETVSMAKKELIKRTPRMPKDELEEKSLRIAIAAIFYGDLKNNRAKNIVFDIKTFVSFEGNTGPYILYSYARAGSILEKAPPEKKFEVYDLEPKEIELVKKISSFPQVVSSAANSLNPSLIANYSYQLAQIFNEFYHACPVIGSEQEAFRLALVQSFRQVLKNAMQLLGISTINKM